MKKFLLGYATIGFCRLYLLCSLGLYVLYSPRYLGVQI